MPRGATRERMIEIGKQTQFSGGIAAKAQRNSAAKKRLLAPLKLTMRGIASEAMQSKAPLPEKTLKAIGSFFSIDPEEVTVMHAAMYKQMIESMRGNLAALVFMRDMIGEKPVDNVAVAIPPDTSALDEAFELLKNSGQPVDNNGKHDGEGENHGPV